MSDLSGLPCMSRSAAVIVHHYAKPHSIANQCAFWNNIYSEVMGKKFVAGLKAVYSQYRQRIRKNGNFRGLYGVIVVSLTVTDCICRL